MLRPSARQRWMCRQSAENVSDPPVKATKRGSVPRGCAMFATSSRLTSLTGHCTAMMTAVRSKGARLSYLQRVAVPIVGTGSVCVVSKRNYKRGRESRRARVRTSPSVHVVRGMSFQRVKKLCQTVCCRRVLGFGARLVAGRVACCGGFGLVQQLSFVNRQKRLT